MTDRIRIGELAEEAGVSRDTIRFYERAGLLPKPRRTATRHRVYDHDVAQQIRFIRRAQDLGLTLDDIRQLIELREAGGEGVPAGWSGSCLSRWGSCSSPSLSNEDVPGA